MLLSRLKYSQRLLLISITAIIGLSAFTNLTPKHQAAMQGNYDNYGPYRVYYDSSSPSH